MSALISIQLDAVESLAAELASLAATLGDEVHLCTSTAASLGTALGGTTGEWAASAGHGWAGLLGVLADRTGAIATTLSSAVVAYRSADGLLSQRMGAGLPRGRAIAR
jgi:hypothetical protein